MDNIKTGKGKEVAYDNIDPAGKQISQEYEISRHGSAVQPSTSRLMAKAIQKLEEALEAMTGFEKIYGKDTTIDTSDTLQSLLDESAKRTTQNWIDHYKPSAVIIKALKKQSSSIQKVFTNWYHNNKYRNHNNDRRYRTLIQVINDHSN